MNVVVFLFPLIFVLIEKRTEKNTAGGKSLHPDHRATYESCLSQIKQQNANKAEYYMYEVCAPFRNPRYYIDITDVLDRKHELIRCHKEMDYEIKQMTLLNQFRASQLHKTIAFEMPRC